MATVDGAGRCRHDLGIPARGARPGTQRPRVRKATSSSSGLSPASSRRYALSRTRSPTTTDVFDWSAPRARSGRPLDHRRAPRAAGPRAPPDGRQTRAAVDRPGRRLAVPIGRQSSASAGDGPALGHRDQQRSPGAVAARGGPRADARVSANGVALASIGRRARAARWRGRAGDRHRGRTRARARSLVTVRPLAPNQRAVGQLGPVESIERRGDLGAADVDGDRLRYPC